tara:strand:- start:24 stop:2081 length:2058 start_codon:yes stop_codon:yes gene_type:complete
MASINQENLRNQTREQIVDFVLEVIIKNGTYSLDKHKRIIDESGNIVFGNQSQDAVVIYQQDFQEAPNSGKFTELIDNITDCFWDAETSTYREPSIDMFRWLEPGEMLPGGNTYPYPIILPEIAYDGSNPFGSARQCPTANPIPVDNFTLNQLSNFTSLQSLKTIIDVDDAKEILDTTIFELLPKSTLRQDQINKFFKDYGNLKPPIPPSFDFDGNITNESTLEYDDIGGANNPDGSISFNKQDGYITRIDDNVDNDNVNKSLEWLRDDLNNYLRDVDKKITNIEDERPEYTSKSKGYLKIRNLNQAIIVRNEESDDIGLIGPDNDNPIWQKDGFTVTMWTKFLDKVNGGTLFNFGNPFREMRPYGFSLETFVLHKDDKFVHNEVEQTFEEYINASNDFDSDHTYFKNDDYERFVRLVVREKASYPGSFGSLVDSHAGTSRSYDGYISKRLNTSEYGYNYVPTLAGKMLGDARNSQINWSTEGYEDGWLASNYAEFGNDGSFWPRKLLSHTRIPVDLDEWYFIVATYNPDIDEYGAPSVDPNNFMICLDFNGELTSDTTQEECCVNGCGGDAQNIWTLDEEAYQMAIGAYGSFTPSVYDSYGPDGANTLKYYSDFWRGDVVPGISDGNGGCTSGRLATAEEISNNDNLNEGDCVGLHTNHSGYGAKCKVEIISRSDLLRARGYKK